MPLASEQRRIKTGGGSAVDLLKVSSSTETGRLARAVAQAVRKANGSGEEVALQAIGAGAVYRAAKAIAAARGLLAPEGIDLAAVPAFCEVEGRDGPITGVRFVLSW